MDLMGDTGDIITTGQSELWVAVHLRWDVNGMLTDVNGIRLDG